MKKTTGRCHLIDILAEVPGPRKEKGKCPGSFSFKFFVCIFSQLLIFEKRQKLRDFSRNFCYTSS